MSEFNRNAWLEKTSEYMAYIEQHKKNVIAAWGELKAALCDIALIQRPAILNQMEWRVQEHDNSKFTEEEFLAYRQHFYPIDGEEVDKNAFDKAWQIHCARNDHHWQHWIDNDGRFLTDYDVNCKLCAYLEMVCDWQAMGYAMGDSAPAYYRAHCDEIKIDPQWKPFVEEILDSLEKIHEQERCGMIVERYFTIKSDAPISKDLFAYLDNRVKVNEAMRKLSDAEGIEGSEYYPGTDVLGIVPTENDAKKFASQLRKEVHEGGIRLFKKRSDIGKKWAAIASEVHPQSKPRLWVYYSFLLGGANRTRLFAIDGVVYCSIEGLVTYEKPDEFTEMKASEFFKVIEDYEGRKNHES